MKPSVLSNSKIPSSMLAQESPISVRPTRNLSKPNYDMRYHPIDAWLRPNAAATQRARLHAMRSKIAKSYRSLSRPRRVPRLKAKPVGHNQVNSRQETKQDGGAAVSNRDDLEEFSRQQSKTSIVKHLDSQSNTHYSSTFLLRKAHASLCRNSVDEELASFDDLRKEETIAEPFIPDSRPNSPFPPLNPTNFLVKPISLASR